MGWLTNLEFTTSPTATNVSDLITGGNQAAQDAELARVCNRATSWCENFCNQPLQAAARTVTERVWVSRDGLIVLHPGPWPLISLTSMSTGSDNSDLTPASSLSRVWIEEECFMVPSFVASSGGLATIQLGARAHGSRMLAQYIYVSGWPHATLAASCLASATSLTLSSTVGMIAGTVLSIVDGSSSEQVTVTAVISATVVSVTATASAHTYTAGVATAIAVHAFPDEIKQAATWVAAGLIRTRGNDAMVMSNLLQAAPTGGIDPVTAKNLWLARDVLGSYRRVR